MLIYQHIPCVLELFNRDVTKVSDSLRSLLNGKSRGPPWGNFGYNLPPRSGLACARTRRCWPFIIEAISSKVSPDRKCCNWCGWSCWIPRLCLLRGCLLFPFTALQTATLLRPPGVLTSPTRGKKWAKHNSRHSLRAGIVSFSIMVSGVLARCPRLMKYLFSHWLNKWMNT